MVQGMLVFAGVLAMLLTAYAQGDAAAGEKSSSIAPPATRASRAKTSGTEPGYNYSSAMKGANVTCHEKTLDEYLQGPGRFVLGTSIVYFMPSEKDRQDIIAVSRVLALQTGLYRARCCRDRYCIYLKIA